MIFRTPLTSSTSAFKLSAEGACRTSSAEPKVPASHPATPAMMQSSVAGYSGPEIARPYFWP